MIHWYENKTSNLFKVNFCGAKVTVQNVSPKGEILTNIKVDRDTWAMGKQFHGMKPMKRKQRLFLQVVTAVNEDIENAKMAQKVAKLF